MTQDTTIVPEEARNTHITATQRFEIIARAQHGMSEYVAPRGTGELTTREAARTALVDHAEYLNRAKDARGYVSARDYVRGGAAYTFGFSIPDGLWLDPMVTYELLAAAHDAKVPKQVAFDWLVAIGRRVGCKF